MVQVPGYLGYNIIIKNILIIKLNIMLLQIGFSQVFYWGNLNPMILILQQKLFPKIPNL